jgi:hypothetical protein
MGAVTHLATAHPWVPRTRGCRAPVGAAISKPATFIAVVRPGWPMIFL